MFSKEEFGRRMREARERKGVSQTEAGRQVGGKAAMISDIENGRRTTTVEKLAVLSEYYGVSTDYLLGHADNPEPPTGGC